MKTSLKTLSFSIDFNFVVTFLLRKAVRIKEAYSTGTFFVLKVLCSIQEIHSTTTY